MRLRPALANLALLLASVAVGLAGLELLARVARARQGGGKEQRTRELYTEYDPLLGWRKRPGARVTEQRRDFLFELSINSKGLRDREREYRPAPGTFRVLVLGDSFVEGFGVRLEDTVAQALEASLSGGRCAAEVVNGGTVGYSTDQEYLFYKEEGQRYAAGVVALFFYHNDVLQNDLKDAFGAPKPRLTFRGDVTKVVNYPVPRPAPRPPTASTPAPPPAPRGSAALAWLQDRLEGWPRVHDGMARLGLWRPLRRVQPHLQLAVYAKRPPPAIEEAWDTTERTLRALAREVAGHGARFVVVYVPSRMEVIDRDWELTRARYGIGERAWDRGRVLADLRRLGERHGFPVVDPTPALRRSTGLLSRPYFEHDGHWNALGHQVAARELEAFLRRQAWIPGCAGASRASTSPVP